MEWLKKYLKKPQVKRNPNEKKISVKHFFYGEEDLIPVKLIGSYKQWKDLEGKFFNTSGNLTFEDIEPLLSRRTPNKSRKELKELYEYDPEEFSWWVYGYYIKPSIAVNPLMVKKSRGGNPYGLDWLEMMEIKTTARHLYAFFSYWLKKDAHDRPVILTGYLSRNKWFTDQISKTKAGLCSFSVSEHITIISITLTMQVIKACYPEMEKMKLKPETFYKQYIKLRPIKPLKSYYSKGYVSNIIVNALNKALNLN